jgi:hypothetical protein
MQGHLLIVHAASAGQNKVPRERRTLQDQVDPVRVGLHPSQTAGVRDGLDKKPVAEDGIGIDDLAGGLGLGLGHDEPGWACRSFEGLPVAGRRSVHQEDFH